MVDHRLASATLTRTSRVALTAMLGAAALCWLVAVRQMSGMDMGVSTELGSFGFFLAAWVPMMAAMMLPSAVPAVIRRAQHGTGLGSMSLFIGVYLAVWTGIGALAFVVYQPHGSVAAGIAVIATGLYELTPLKARCRERCRLSTRSGEFALACVGSSIGLMVALLALGVMDVAWMSIIAVLIVAQKILPAHRAADYSIALAILVLGVWILAAPASIPGLVPTM